jgi:hypothetical protein
MAIDIRKWVYTADNGDEYALGVASYIVAQLDASDDPIIGGRAAVGTDTLHMLPRGMKPRHVTVVNAATGKKRTVVCLQVTAPLFTGAVGAITLQDGAGATASYVRAGPEPEKFRKRAAGV